jgi:hypothetical protein
VGDPAQRYSRPFEKPTKGRIAVKVINYLGDEVMKDGRPARNGWNSPVNGAQWGADYLNRSDTEQGQGKQLATCAERHVLALHPRLLGRRGYP